MSKSYDGLQPQDDPLKGNDDRFIIEYNGSDSNSKSVDEDRDECTEEIYLDIDSSDHIEEAGELTDGDNSIASPELEDLFHCSTCNIDFQSVENHIKQFHGGHEVVLDIGNGQQEYHIEDSEVAIKMEPANSEDLHDPLEQRNADELLYQKILKPLPIVNCKICGVPYAAPKGIAAHMRTHIDNAAAKNLPIPDKKKAKSTKKKESLYEDGITSTVCEICNTIFTSSKGLKLHARMHNPIRQRTLEEAAEHELLACPTKILEGEQTFFCEICQKSFDMSFKEIHIQSHDGEEKYMCTSCNRKFATEVHLNMHLSAHNEPRQVPTKAGMRDIKLPYACQYCPKEFARPHEKVKHERVHTGEKPHSCEICGKCFRISYCLTLHMRTHTDARPYVCPKCNKRFKSQSVYNHHLMTHSDLRPYQCPYCPKAFKTPVQLSGHRNSHTKPFSCTECSRPFATLYAVKAHMESHKRPNHNLKHACQICGATYARGFALKDHIKEQHSNEMVTDENEIVLIEDETVPINVKDEAAMDDEETKLAGQSILPDHQHSRTDSGIEIIIGEIEQFANEEVVTDWMK